MAIVPVGYPIGLQDAGSNPTVTQAPTLTDIDITVGTTSFNTLQAWTEIAYSGNPFGGYTYYTRYIKNLTGGWLHGYSLSMGYSGSLSVNGSSIGPGARGMLCDSGAPGSSSGASLGPSTTFSGSPWSSNRSEIMKSSGSTYGGIPPNGGVPSPNQLPETLHQTFSYQGLTHHGQDITFNTSGSIGSVSNTSTLSFTATNGEVWHVLQFIGGKNVYTTGNFPNKLGPYSGSHRTSSNIGNFIYLAIYREGTYYSNTQAQGIYPLGSGTGLDADNIFSHIEFSGSSTVLTSGLSGVSHSSGQSGIAPSGGDVVWGQITANVNNVLGFLWSGLTDSQVETFVNYPNSSLSISIKGPVSSTSYNNGVAEEHGGADSSDVKMSDYIKGGTYVAAGNTSSTIASSLSDVSISDYRDTEDDGSAAGVTSVFISSASNGDFYPYRGAAVYGAIVEYVYMQGLQASSAYGSFTPSTALGRTFSIDGTNQVLTEASIAYATPAGTNLICRFTPASANANDILGNTDWTSIVLTKTNNTSHSNTLTLTSSSSGYSYSTLTSSQASGQIIPTANLSFIINSPSTTNNYIYNWITDNGTKTGLQDFTISIT